MSENPPKSRSKEDLENDRNQGEAMNYLIAQTPDFRNSGLEEAKQGQSMEHLISQLPSAETTVREQIQKLREAVEALQKQSKSTSEAGKKTETPETKAAKKERGKKTAKSSMSREEFAAARAEDAGLKKEREAMLAAEREYLDEQRGFYTKHSKVGRFWEGSSAKMKGLENKYNQASFDFEQALEKRVQDRKYSEETHSALRGGHYEFGKRKGEVKPGISREEFAKKVAARYRRMVISRDIIDRGAAQLAETRASALDAKGKKSYEKALGWMAGINKGLEEKLGKKGARAARIITGAAVGALAGSLTGGAGFLWGFGTRTARTILGTSFGAAAGYGAGKVYMATLGKGAAEKLATERETAAADAKGIKAKRKAYARGTEEAIAKKRALVESLTAVLTGAGISMESARLFTNSEVVTQALSDVSNSTPVGSPAPEVPAPPVENVVPNTAPALTPSVEGSSPLAPVAGLAPVASAESTGMEHFAATSVEVRTGEGAIGLFKHLQQQLQETYANADRATLPHSVQHMLTLSPQELAKEYGFYNPAAVAESALIPKGATLGIDSSGSLVYETPGAHGPHLAVLEEGQAGTVHRYEGSMRDSDAVSRARSGLPVDSELREAAAREQTDTRELMRQQHLRNVEAQRAFDAQRAAPMPIESPVTPPATPEAVPVSPVAPVEAAQASSSQGVPTERPLTSAEKIKILNDWSRVHAGEPWPPNFDYQKAAAELANQAPSSIESRPVTSPGQISESSPIVSNHFGIQIDQRIPALYVEQLPGGREEVVLHGGSLSAREIAAENYARLNPGVAIRYDSSSQTDPLTGRLIPQSTQIIFEAGKIQRIIPLEGSQPIPDTERFVRKMPLTSGS